MCAQSFSGVCLFATPWTVAYQAPLSMEFSRQEYRSGLPFPTSGNLLNPGISNLSLLHLLHCEFFFFFFLPPCCLGSTNALISHASKVMLKILQAGFSNTWTVNFLMFKLVLEKAEGPEIKLPTSTGSWKSKAVPEKHLFLLYWLCQSLWLCGSQSTVENSERWEYQTTWPASWEICMQVRKQQLELDMEQQTGSK